VAETGIRSGALDSLELLLLRGSECRLSAVIFSALKGSGLCENGTLTEITAER
jgi:hypothetical protein